MGLLCLVIQISGARLIDKNLNPILRPNLVLHSIGIAGLVIRTLAPLFPVSGLSMLRKETAGIRNPMTRVLGRIGALLLAVVSFGELLWSCGGHPTRFLAFA